MDKVTMGFVGDLFVECLKKDPGHFEWSMRGRGLLFANQEEDWSCRAIERTAISGVGLLWEES